MAEATNEIGSFEQLLTLLGAQGFTGDEFLRDALWLAQYVASGPGREPRPEAKQKPPAGDIGDAAQKHGEGGKKAPSPQSTTPAPRQDPLPGPDEPDELDAGRLYPKVDPLKDAGRKATAIYVPASGALPQPLELARALRPFQEKFRSRRLTRLDIVATAELSAERREVTPVLVRERERWFSLSLLVDDAPSMAVWRKTARELARFLGTLGIFRDVRTWAVDQDLRLTARGGRRATPKQLADPTGRTLIVILTNGVGRHWQSREMMEWLTDWARNGPVAICSLLPPMRWESTDLGPAYLWARASSPGAGNRMLTAGEGSRTVRLKDGATVFPVFPLTSQGLEQWAAMQMSRRETTIGALPISRAWFEPLEKIAAEPAAVDVAERVAEFRSFASPDSARLLELFSAIPLSLPVMRLVQYAMMPHSPLSSMAEVLMSGLVVPSRMTPAGADPESMLFDFTPEARKYLRDRTSIGDLERIQREVSGAIQDYIERRAGVSTIDFEAWVDDPAGLKELPPDVQYFVQVTAETLRALGYRKPWRPPVQPDQRPGVYVTWDVPELEAFAKEIAAGLNERGLRVLVHRDGFPAKGSILMVAKDPQLLESEHLALTEELARWVESGLEGVILAGPGVTPADDGYLYADHYSNRDEMLEAVVAKIGKRDVNPPPAPKGAPPLDRIRGLVIDADATEVRRLMGQATVVLFSNELFQPAAYVRDLVWLRDNRLRYTGGIQWLRAGEQAEERPAQLLIFESAKNLVRIPAECSAVLLDPEIGALFDLPDSAVSYEGTAEAVAKTAADRAELLPWALPDFVIEDVRQSPRLIQLMRGLMDQDLWPSVRERFAQEWLRSKPSSVVGFAIHIGTTAFEALEPALHDGAGLASALRDGAPDQLIDSLIPLEKRKALAGLGLLEGPAYQPAWSCRRVARMSWRWPEWNAEILAATGLSATNWSETVTRNPYVRRHGIYHLLQSGNLTAIEEAVTSFGWWALRLEEDGMERLAEDLRLLPEDREAFRQVQALLNSLENAAELSREQLAGAIWNYDLPLPSALRNSADVAVVPGAYTPSRFLLLAGSRRASPDNQMEQATVWVAEAIARDLAKRGWGLICGAEDGSDAVAALAFAEQRSVIGITADTALRIVAYGDHAVPFLLPPGTSVIRRDDPARVSVRLATAVVVLGGNQWVTEVARAAAAQGKRVFAAPGTGGAAEILYRQQVEAGAQWRNAKWAGSIKTKEDASEIALALVRDIVLLDDIAGAGATKSLPDARIAEWSACRSRVLPPFVVKALGSSPADKILVDSGLIQFDAAGGAVIEEKTHAFYHGSSTPDVHGRISEAIEANPASDLGLHERLFHLIDAGQREKAVSVATDVAWLIPAVELGDPKVFDDLLALGMSELAADLRASGKPIRARLASSRNLAMARAAIRYQNPSTYVEVAGTGSHSLDQLTQLAAEAMGTALARAGFGLITGAWPGVDYVVAAMYLNGGGKSLVHAVTPSSIERFKEAMEVDAQEEDTAEKLADAVVLIGGAGGTMRSFVSARALGKPVFPYGASGGDAQKAVGLLPPAEAGPLQTVRTPELFASFVVRKLGTGEQSAGLERMWELAARYDEIRMTMPSGPKRTGAMTALFKEMSKEAPAVADRLVELQRSPSAGHRLAAIAILQSFPRREELDWLAERLDNPEGEKPFVGFQAGMALLAAVRSLSPVDCDLLERILDKAGELAEKLPTDEDRLRLLTKAELELMAKRSTRDEELDVTKLVHRELPQHGYRNAVLTRNLPIFRTKAQRSWITFTTVGVFCTLDNRPRGENFFRVQWFQTLGDIDPASVITRDRPEKSGLLTIGARRNWLYSRQMFNSTTLRNAVLRELERAIEFGERVKRYDLM